MDPLAQRLRSERERQGLSVRDLAVVTKIREPYIEAVERGRYDVLPAVYVRSFVRTLGSALGISSKEINKLMDDAFEIEAGETPERLPAAKAPQPPSQPLLSDTMAKASEAVSATVQKAGSAVTEGFQRARDLVPATIMFQDQRRLIIIGIVLGVVLLSAIAWFIFSGGDDENAGLMDRTSTEITVGSDGASMADSMLLTAEVVDSAWLTITMDGARTRQLVLVPGEEYEWRASKTFVLSLNNAGGVRFFRDGEALPLFGQKGQAVRRVTITRTEVVSSIKGTPGQPPPPTAAAPVQAAPKPAPTPAPKPVTTTTAPPPEQPKPTVTRRRAAPAKKPVAKKPVRRRSIPMITPAPTRPQPLRP
ncbi:MAG: helix-turn-helix domain-containing protein [Ignavibacteriae bacterium]|nr:MAG: helix-turn-helix domain-containing protein [Ignavibacteriota bacterium]